MGGQADLERAAAAETQASDRTPTHVDCEVGIDLRDAHDRCDKAINALAATEIDGELSAGHIPTQAEFRGCLTRARIPGEIGREAQFDFLSGKPAEVTEAEQSYTLAGWCLSGQGEVRRPFELTRWNGCDLQVW